MAEIIPAVIGQNFSQIEKKLKQVDELVTWAQLDVMDGTFTREYSWNNPADLAELNGKIKLEAHLMLEEPEQVVEDWAAVCDRVIVHLEATKNLSALIDKINLSPCESAICLLLDTPLEKLEPYLDRVKNIQLMGIATIGHHGEPLAEKIYDKIKTLRSRHPDVKISIDGGVNLDNAKKLVAAGADRLVVGSAIWDSENLSKTIQAFRNLTS